MNRRKINAFLDDYIVQISALEEYYKKYVKKKDLKQLFRYEKNSIPSRKR